MKKITSLIILYFISIVIASYAISQTCYTLNTDYVGYFCNSQNPCTDSELCGDFQCCIYASEGFTECIEGGTDVYYQLRSGTACSIIPCYWASSTKYCNYGQPDGYPDDPWLAWVARDTLGGDPCP